MHRKVGIDAGACKKSLVNSRVQKVGVQVAIVIGGGNIFRGIQSKRLGIERTPADQMGMLATLSMVLCLHQSSSPLAALRA